MTRKRSLAAALCLLFLGSVALAQRFTLEQVMSSPFPDWLTAAEKAPRIAWMFNMTAS